MKSETLTAALDVALRSAGHLHRLAPIAISETLDDDIRGLREQGLLSERLHERYGHLLRFTPPSEVPEPRTFIVVAWPSPAVKVRFEIDTGPLEAVIPPTYISSEARARCLETLRAVLGEHGHTVARAQVAAKLLAARTGLARYGRNNLAYVRGMGTFARLEAFCTDADLRAEVREHKGSLRMSSCPPCRNCHHHCPTTGCIPYDGTVIDATRCLTCLNEEEGEWPEWLDPAVHHCLVGCMRCQEMCSADRFYLRKEPVVAEFDRAETDIVLRNLPAAQLPGPLLAKLRSLDMEEYSTVLGRNLLALRDATAAALTAAASTT